MIKEIVIRKKRDVAGTALLAKAAQPYTLLPRSGIWPWPNGGESSQINRPS